MAIALSVFGAVVVALLTQLFIRASAQLTQAQDDTARLLALTTKHGGYWGGSDGSRVPVDGYQAAGRLAGNPQASATARAAAARLLDADEWPFDARPVARSLRDDVGTPRLLPRVRADRSTATPQLGP